MVCFKGCGDSFAMALLDSLQVRMGLDAAEFRRGFQNFQKDLKKGVGKFQRNLKGLTSVGSLGWTYGGAWPAFTH